MAISDVKTYIAYVEVTGVFYDNTSDNEDIEKEFYTAKQVENLLETEEFSSRAQIAAYNFVREFS